ncbi:hypothetical protein BH23ACT12_BH23ACT12_11840 [soil metagenome]
MLVSDSLLRSSIKFSVGVLCPRRDFMQVRISSSYADSGSGLT